MALPSSSSSSSLKTEQLKGYLFPFLLVTSLFFFWGFVHNLDPILIPHLRKAFTLNFLQSSLLTSLYSLLISLWRCLQGL